MFKITPEVAEPMLEALASVLEGGFMFLFAGPEPAAPSDPLDMVTDHTQLALISIGNDGITGLQFDPATGNILAKVDADVWRGTVTVDGADPATTQTPTFFRMGGPGDDCRDDTPGPRMQGTVTGPSGGGDLLLGAPTLTDNGTNTVTITIANIQMILG